MTPHTSIGYRVHEYKMIPGKCDHLAAIKRSLGGQKMSRLKNHMDNKLKAGHPELSKRKIGMQMFLDILLGLILIAATGLAGYLVYLTFKK
jgi:hypothetical protein